MILRIVCLALLWIASACVDASSVRCGEIWCPIGSECSADQKRCVWSAQLTACEDKRENDSCLMAGTVEALCIGGACTPVICGDGEITGSEVCDDGNTAACDGCSSNCRSDESCGNSIVECTEQCDEGENSNSVEPNATCRPNCQIQRCGDGIVDNQSGEDCDGAPNPSARCADYGFYDGEIGCSTACRNDTTGCSQACGDGVANGTEICDSLWSTSQSCLDYGYDIGSLMCSALCTPSFARCERQGFQATELTNSAGFIFGVWGRGTNDMFAFGNDVLLHYDGTAWTAMDTSKLVRPRGEPNVFVDGWGATSGEVFAVGYAGVIAEYDGGSWRAMDSGVEASLTSVWGFAADDVFAVGGEAVLLHYDGEAWSAQVAPVADRQYYGVWGSSSSDVYAVHDFGIDHFDGSTWSLSSAPTDAFFSIWGSGADDIFAVGDRGSIAHFDGESWSRVSHGATEEPLLSVTGSGPHDVYASGDRGLVIRYDGERWTPVPTEVNQQISSIWSAGSDDVYAGASLELLHLGQGGPTLREIDTGSTEPLLSVWMTSPEDVTVVGISGTAIHFDGKNWTREAVEQSEEDFSDIWAADAKHKWATGNKIGTIHAFDGSAWKLVELPIDVPFYSIWGRNKSDVYAVGEAGVILHWDGSTWSVDESGTTDLLEVVWGFDDGTVYVGSVAGQLLRRTTVESWRVVFDQPSQDFWGVWGSAPDQVVVAADSQTHFLLGETYHTVPLRSGMLINVISGSSLSDMFGIPIGTVALYHFDGLDWAPLRLPTSSPALYNITMGRERGYVVGVGNTIVEIDRHCASVERNCADRWDNDCDGLKNCADPDCTDNRACAQGGACNVSATVECGASFSGTTASGQPVHALYPCAGRAQPGREVFHQLVTEADGRVTITLEQDAADLDLIVLSAAAAGGCEPSTGCLTASTRAGEREVVSFDGVAGGTYYISVDASERQSFAPYLLTIDCQP